MRVKFKVPNRNLYITYIGSKQEIALDSKQDNLSQTWDLIYLSNGNVLIKSAVTPNECLDIYDDDLSKPITWPCNNKGGFNREWTINIFDNKKVAVRSSEKLYLAYSSHLNGDIIYSNTQYKWDLISEEKTTISFATRNILAYNENRQDWIDLLNELYQMKPDILGLQEVVKYAYKLLDKWRDEYLISDPIYTSQGHTTVLLVKKILNPILFQGFPLPDSPKRQRHAFMATLDYADKRIGVATAHIESIFFTEKATQIKCNQITYITNKLMDQDIESAVFMGDCNLTQGSELVRENNCIAKNGLIDVWKELRGTTDNYDDPKYRREDATWDYTNNHKIYHQEWHRPDRIFYFNVDSEILVPKYIERIVNEYSDHYGLYATFES